MSDPIPSSNVSAFGHDILIVTGYIVLGCYPQIPTKHYWYMSFNTSYARTLCGIALPAHGVTQADCGEICPECLRLFGRMN